MSSPGENISCFWWQGKILGIAVSIFLVYMSLDENTLDLLAEESYLQKKEKYMTLTTVTALIRLMGTANSQIVMSKQNTLTSILLVNMSSPGGRYFFFCLVTV